MGGVEEFSAAEGKGGVGGVEGSSAAVHEEGVDGMITPARKKEGRRRRNDQELPKAKQGPL